MATHQVTLTNVTLVIEVDAPNADAARGAIYNAFKGDRPFDALQGTRFTFDKTERECSTMDEHKLDMLILALGIGAVELREGE